MNSPQHVWSQVSDTQNPAKSSSRRRQSSNLRTAISPAWPGVAEGRSLVASLRQKPEACSWNRIAFPRYRKSLQMPKPLSWTSFGSSLVLACCQNSPMPNSSCLPQEVWSSIPWLVDTKSWEDNGQRESHPRPDLRLKLLLAMWSVMLSRMQTCPRPLRNLAPLAPSAWASRKVNMYWLVLVSNPYRFPIAAEMPELACSATP